MNGRLYRHCISFCPLLENPNPSDEELNHYQNDQHHIWSPTTYKPNLWPYNTQVLTQNSFSIPIWKSAQSGICQELVAYAPNYQRTPIWDNKHRFTLFLFWWDFRLTSLINWLVRCPIETLKPKNFSSKITWKIGTHQSKPTANLQNQTPHSN